MEKESKLFTIFKAFTGNQTISEDIQKKRLEICGSCPYNSKNADISLLGNGRRKVMGDYCTACGCQLKEKTSVPYEECGLGSIGKKPLWNRLSLITSSASDFNVFIEETDYRLDLAGDVIKVNCYDVLQDILIINLLLEKKREDIDFISFKAGCVLCSSISNEIEGDLCRIHIEIDTSILMDEHIEKNFYIDYVKENNNPYTQIIKIIFNNL